MATTLVAAPAQVPVNAMGTAVVTTMVSQTPVELNCFEAIHTIVL